MKKVKFIVIALAALFIVSCSQSKEDKFISSVEEFVVQIENMSDTELKENGAMIESQFKSKIETLYGVKFNNKLVEDAETAGLTLNQEQKEKLLDLEGRLVKRAAELFKSNKDDEDSGDLDTELSLTDTSNERSSFDLGNVLLPSQLKGKVEIISAEKSIGSYGYPEMEITFKLLSTVNTSSLCSEYGQMWIVGVGQTENGVDVKELLPNYREWRSSDSDGNEFKAFLESEPGETITLQFTGDKDSSNDVESDLEKVKKFKLKITN